MIDRACAQTGARREAGMTGPDDYRGDLLDG